jgi:hypothetical protein
MSLLTGIFNTTQNPTELNARSFADTILRLFPNGGAPLWALAAKAGKRKAKSSTHGYFSKTMTFVTTTSTAGDTSAATTLTVGSTTGMTANMVIHNVRTRENVRVVSVTNATQVVVSRAFGRVAAATINTADKLLQVGTAFEEGSTRPASRRLATVYVGNYTQIFRNAWGLTDTARASMSEMGYSNVAEDRKDCSLFHSVDMESAVMHGQAKMDTTGSQPVHSTQGVVDSIYQYAAANVNPASSTTSYSQLVALVEEPFNYSTDIGNNGERIGFCDRLAMKVLTDVGRKSGQIQVMQSETSFGMKFTSFRFYQGTINLIQHPLMNGLDPTGGNLLIVDMAAIKLAYMDGRDAVPEEYGTNGKQVELGTDGVGGSLTSEFAVENINPFACGYVTGLTAGAADA